MSGWRHVADELESRLEAAERLLDAGDVAGAQDDLPMPAIPPEAPTGEERRRLDAIDARTAVLRNRMRQELSRLGGELAETAKRKSAPRAYR
jgi:hypothetical protein